MYNKAETFLMFLVLVLVIGGCIALRHGRQGMRDAAKEYESIPRTITYTPTTIEWYEGCMEDEPCWDCKTMGNKICGNGGK